MSKEDRLKRDQLFRDCISHKVSLSEGVSMALKLFSVGELVGVGSFSYGLGHSIANRKASRLIRRLVILKVLHREYGSTKNATYKVVSLTPEAPDA